MANVQLESASPWHGLWWGWRGRPGGPLLHPKLGWVPAPRPSWLCPWVCGSWEPRKPEAHRGLFSPSKRAGAAERAGSESQLWAPSFSASQGAETEGERRAKLDAGSESGAHKCSVDDAVSTRGAALQDLGSWWLSRPWGITPNPRNSRFLPWLEEGSARDPVDRTAVQVPRGCCHCVPTPK